MSTYTAKVRRKQGGDTLEVASGGLIDVLSGGAIHVGGVSVDASSLAVTGLTATKDDLNLLAGMAAATQGVVKVAKVALSGAAIHAAVQAWQNPESGSIIINRAIVDVTTIATAAGKLDIGTTAVGATTASDNLIDGIDVNAGTGLLGQADGDGTNGKLQQKLAAGKWVTIKEISGDVTGLVGSLYVFYILA